MIIKAEDASDLAAWLDESPAALFIVDCQGKWRYMNRACRELLTNGVVPPEGSSWQDNIDAADRALIIAEWHARTAAGERFEAEFRPGSPGGSTRWLRVLARPLPGGGSDYSAEVVDVTVRHESLESARTRD